MKINIAWLPLAKASWLDNRVNEVFEHTQKILGSLSNTIIAPKQVITSEEEAAAAAQLFTEKKADVIIVQAITFSLGSIIPAVTRICRAPIILWSMPEPPMHGGRIKANSFCSANLNSYILKRMGKKYFYLYADLQQITEKLTPLLTAVSAKKYLCGLKIGMAGSRVPGFYTSNYRELPLAANFGITVQNIELLEIKNEADHIGKKDHENALKEINSASSVNKASQEEAEKGADLLCAFRALAGKYSLQAFAVKCWPEFGDLFGLAICSTLGMLTESGITAGCEGDMYGTVSMLLGGYLSPNKPMFCDLISYDEQNNEGIIWHCGAAAPSLACPGAEKILSKHSIMDGGGIKGLTNEFPCKGGPITILRLTDDGEGFKMLCIRAEGLETGQIICGNPLKVKFFSPVSKIIGSIMDEGIEHHYAAAYGDISESLAFWCRLNNVRLINF
ncbi:MAG: hypothetical protein A2096_09620 [Spirochaetes bacterium GWF1_41_5]|nr:MAG: hypothetical protein A2096_09620 [Spirochaetes bacterium GWF1_41_5]HBE01338.1 hypothetical protein [Spirochaetia bacterium]